MDTSTAGMNAERVLAFVTFKNAKKTHPHLADATWPALAARLQQCSVRGIDPEVSGKDGPGFSFARYAAPRRSNENVLHLSALVLDVDGGASYDDLAAGIAHLEHVAYSTHRSTAAHPKFRLVFPLVRDVSPAEWLRLWQAGAALIAGNADKAAKDPARFYYFHSCSKANEADAFRHHQIGAWLDPDALLTTSRVAAPGATTQHFSANDDFVAGIPESGPDPARVCGDGERTNHLTSLAGMWIAQGHGLGAVKSQAAQWNERNTPPLPFAKVYSTCEGIWRTHMRNHALPASSTAASAAVTTAAASAGPTISFGILEPVQPLFDLQSAAGSRLLSVVPPARRWLLRDCLPCGKVAAIIAPGGTGKSIFSLQLAVSVACGLPLAGVWHVEQPGPVLGLFAEDDEEEIHRRLHSIVTQLRSEGMMTPEVESRLKENLFVRSMVADNNLMTSALPNGHVVQLPYVQRLVATVRQAPAARLVIVDPASRFRGGQENSAEDATRFVEALEFLSKTTGATVVVLHHANKGSMQGGEQSQSASRGSSAFSDGVRWQMNLSPLTEKEAKTLGIIEERRSHYLSATVTKNNYAPPQATVFLKRGDGGCLSNAGLSIASDAKRNETTLAVLRKIAECQGIYSMRTFEQDFGGRDNIFGVSAGQLRGVVNQCIEEGYVAKNSGGRKNPLVLTSEGEKFISAAEIGNDVRRAMTCGDVR